ncbi:MAG: isoprenylcysteine carboxylmethyltransferase family protein [Flavobacteriaceae bacterium]
MSTKSLLLVIIQFSCFVYFAFAGNLVTSNLWLMLQLLGLLLGLWGIVVMKMGNFNVQPEVKNSANLVVKGPYKLIRNPMYSGLLLFFGISVVVNFEISRFVVYVILATVLILKIYMEEGFLSEKFGKEYKTYKEKSFRLIPFVY